MGWYQHVLTMRYLFTALHGWSMAIPLRTATLTESNVSTSRVAKWAKKGWISASRIWHFSFNQNIYTHRIHVCYIWYMVTFTINIPPMLVYIYIHIYIYHTWILWDRERNSMEFLEQMLVFRFHFPHTCSGSVPQNTARWSSRWTIAISRGFPVLRIHHIIVVGCWFYIHLFNVYIYRLIYHIANILPQNVC